MVPAVQILVYSVFLSENVVAASVAFDMWLFFYFFVLGVSAVFSGYGSSCGGRCSDDFRILEPGRCQC